MKVLTQYMALLGLSQVDLAKKLGVAQGQLSHWLAGTRVPSGRSLKMISEKTGLSADKLLEDVRIDESS